LNIETATNGTCGVTIPLPTPVYPNTPHVSNWTAAQAIDGSADFTLRWDAYTGGTTNDFVQVRVEGDMGDLFNSPEPGAPGGLDGTSTSVVIPGGTLAPGARYRATLLFANVLTMAPGICGDAVGISAFHKETEFAIVTVNPNGVLEFSTGAYVVAETNGT